MYFRQDIEEKIFSCQEMQTIPLGCQSTALHVIEEVITEIWEGDTDAKLSILFLSADTDASLPTISTATDANAENWDKW